MSAQAVRTRDLLDRLGAAVNLRAGEAPLVLLVLAHSFLNGVPKTLTNSAASAIFLEQHGAQYLPYAYMASAVIVTIIGYGFVKLGRVLSFPARLQAVLWVVVIGTLALRGGIALLGVKRASVVFPVWVEIEWSIIPLQFWGLAGQLFNLQQGKRIYTLLGVGELISSTLMGFLLPAEPGVRLRDSRQRAVDPDVRETRVRGSPRPAGSRTLRPTFACRQAPSSSGAQRLDRSRTFASP